MHRPGSHRRAVCYNELIALPALIENLSVVRADFPDINLVYPFGLRLSGQIGLMSDHDLAIFAAGNALSSTLILT